MRPWEESKLACKASTIARQFIFVFSYYTMCSDLLLEINPIFQILYKLVENLKVHFMLNFILTAW